MPVGPNGEKRPADPIANAVLIGKLATGETAEEHVNRGQSAGGKKGGRKRADTLTPERRSEIAKKAAAARWGGP